MRRVAAIISVCFVCLTLCLSLPIEGRALSNNDGPYWYSVLQFDYIQSGWTIPCPFNFSAQGTQREPFEFLDFSVNGYVNLISGSSYMNGYLNALVEPDICFYSSLQVVRMKQLKETFSYSISPGFEEMHLGGADVSCTVITLSDNAFNTDEVFAAHHDVSGFIGPTANGSVNIGSGLYQILSENGFGDETLVLISDLTIRIPFYCDTTQTPNIFVSSFTTSLDPDLLFGQWVGYQGIVVPDAPTGSPDSTGFNLGTWLAESVSGFLKAEIFPGFSIDKIFYIVLVIGVLLWFFKVIS